MDHPNDAVLYDDRLHPAHDPQAGLIEIAVCHGISILCLRETLMIRIVGIAALAVALCGCATTTPAERLAGNQASCQAYGFKPNTDAFASCIMQQEMADDASDADRRTRISAGLQAMGQSMTQPQRQTVTCNTFGGPPSIYRITTTTCR